MKIEKIYCDRCGKEISPLMNKPSITLHKKDSEVDLCGLCISSFYIWFSNKLESEEQNEQKNL